MQAADQLSRAEARVVATRGQITKLECRLAAAEADGHLIQATKLRGRLLSMNAFLQAELARLDHLRRETNL